MALPLCGVFCPLCTSPPPPFCNTMG
jgi:hypothetical protein